MKDVALHDRPREKLERLGVSGLGDNELLALVLGSGSRGGDALDLANRLIAHAGGVHGLTRTAVADLQRVAGVGRARAAQVLAAVELGRRTLLRDHLTRPRLQSPRQLAGYLLPLYGSHPVERFGVVLLDTRNRLLETKLLGTGSMDTAIIHPREVYRDAIACRAAGLVIFHNHPSGDPTPSPDDVGLTDRMARAGEVVGIALLDHLVLADQSYYSFMEARRLPLHDG